MDYVNPKELMQEVRSCCKRKSELGIGNMLIRGILAGAFLGFATSLAMIVIARVALHCGRDSVSAGFVMLVLLGFELATGNFALLPVGLLAAKCRSANLLRNWSWIYFGTWLEAGSMLSLLPGRNEFAARPQAAPSGIC